MATSTTKTVVAATGGIAAAVASALCCAGPLIAVALGLSGAGLATTFEPLRPYFVVATGLALGFGFVVLNREERKACEPGTIDRKSTRLNSSHSQISYAVFCLKKKKKR